MADGGGIKQITQEMEQTGREVAKDVKDSVGEMIEQAVQTTATPLTPQQIQQQQQQKQQQQIEDQKKLVRVRGWFKGIEEAQRKVREEAKQKEMQRLQQKESKKQDEKIKFFEQKQKKQIVLGPTPMSNIENKSKFSS